jgi:hypothetical protein
MKMNTYILHWLDGKTETVKGSDIADAFSRAGYGAGAIRALDWYDIVK